jgi:hypothetical protein
MKMNILATAAALSDKDLLARLSALAGQERATSVELVAHLAELEARPAVYAAQGFGSLYAYCTQALASPRMPRAIASRPSACAGGSRRSSICSPRAT